MKTIKLHIRRLSDPALVERDCNSYTHAFMLMYKTLDQSSDREFITRFKGRFGLTDIAYRSLVAQVKSARKQDITNDEERLDRIADLSRRLETTEAQHKYKIYKKIAELRKRLGKERTFGGLATLRALSKECGKANPDPERVARLREEYHDNRKKPLYVVGEANRKGNRFFDFSELHKGRCVYKPRKGESCEIAFKTAYAKDLERIAKYTELKELAVSVSLSDRFLCLSFDEQQLNGYGVDERERFKEVRKIKAEHHAKEIESEKIRSAYRAFYDEQRERMMQGKIEGRCVAVDLNPTNIGWSVLDKASDGRCMVVACGWYSYDYLCRHLHKASGSAEQKHLNNKRKHELTIIVRNLFRIANHYRCSQFVMEDLSFKKDSDQGREANRKNKNLWCRELLQSLVARRCNEQGIILVEVTPCYSSFIGNIQHPYVDATNASVEIGRRGLWKYTNGTFYPDIRREDLSTVEAMFGADAKGINTDGWGRMYNALTDAFDKKEFAYRLRTAIDKVETPYRSFSMNSCKSGVNSLVFITLH